MEPDALRFPQLNSWKKITRENIILSTQVAVFANEVHVLSGIVQSIGSG